MSQLTFSNQLLHRTTLSPLQITLSSYNRQIMAVQDLEQLFTFTTSDSDGRITHAHANAIAEGFKQVFFRYLNGIGHVPGTLPDHVTEEEYRLRASDPLFRAKVTLRQLTDSWLLPVGDDLHKKIEVRCAFPNSSPVINHWYV
jgi:hypothetical protein